MSLNYPQLYALGIRNTFLTYSVFVFTIIEGVFAAVIVYVLPYCAMRHAVRPDGRGLADHKTFGVVVQTVLTVAVTLRVGHISLSLSLPLSVRACVHMSSSLAAVIGRCRLAVGLSNNTITHRAFPVAGACIWNDLPADVTSAPSLLIFRKRLKLHLFRQSYPGLVL